MTADVELSDELFIVTKETAETYLKDQSYDKSFPKPTGKRPG